MQAQKDRMMSSINCRVLVFFHTNKFGSSLNKNDGALSAEDFIKDLFNILYESDSPAYINTKKLKQNYPGIDVLSTSKQQGIQVTVRTDTGKVTETFGVIPKCEDNNDYKEILFVIQGDVLPSNLKKIKSPRDGYVLTFVSATEILREIEGTDLDHLKRICHYIEKAIVIPDEVAGGEVNVDAAVFNILFASLKNNLLKKDSLEVSDEEVIFFKTSHAKKKEKFKPEWATLEQLYKDSLGLKEDGSGSGRLIAYHKYIEEAFSQDLSEDDKQLIQSYLKTKSVMILHKNQGDPIKALDEMVTTMREELDLRFVPASHVLSFILNMFFKCDVFPLIGDEV